MNARILFVDDEVDVFRFYGSLLKAEGYTVRYAKSGDQAFSLAKEAPPDLVISDVSMADGDGFSLIARLRGHKSTSRLPIILMSGVRVGPDEQAEGLDHGADDYLPKPFAPDLLRAKVSTVLRRAGAAAELHDELKARGLALDVSARTVAVSGKTVALTRKEFDLLAVFLRKPGRVLSIPFLLESVWGYDPADYSDPHTVGVHVWTLRRKLGAKLGKRIVAVPGLGYRYDA